MLNKAFSFGALTCLTCNQGILMGEVSLYH
jgi:hypothetical protein